MCSRNSNDISTSFERSRGRWRLHQKNSEKCWKSGLLDSSPSSRMGVCLLVRVVIRCSQAYICQIISERQWGWVDKIGVCYITYLGSISSSARKDLVLSQLLLFVKWGALFLNCFHTCLSYPPQSQLTPSMQKTQEIPQRCLFKRDLGTLHATFQHHSPT